MALKALVLQNRINKLNARLQELQATDADFTAREESLTADIMAAQTEEERQAVEAAATAFDADQAAHESAMAAIVADIQAAQTELAGIEEKQTPPAQAAAPEAEHNNERMTTTMIPQTSVRSATSPSPSARLMRCRWPSGTKSSPRKTCRPSSRSCAA